MHARRAHSAFWECVHEWMPPLSPARESTEGNENEGRSSSREGEERRRRRARGGGGGRKGGGTRALKKKKRERRENCSFSNDSGERWRVRDEAGPFWPLRGHMWPLLPSACQIWRGPSLEAVFHREGPPNPPFLSACARKWLRRPNMAAPFTLSSAKKGSNPSPAKAFAFVSNSRPFLAFSNASFVQFDSSNQEVFFFRPTFLPPLQLGLSPLRGQKGGNLPFDCLSRAWRKGRLLVCSEITSVSGLFRTHLFHFCGNSFWKFDDRVSFLSEECWDFSLD